MMGIRSAGEASGGGGMFGALGLDTRHATREG
jgi:hypothetical protein